VRDTFGLVWIPRVRNSSWFLSGSDCITTYGGMQRQKSEKFDKGAHFVIDFASPGGVSCIAECLSAPPADLFSRRRPNGLLKAAQLRLRDVRRG
jgi:hypothetical protein